MRIYNDLTRQKEELTPQVEGEYKIYVCGPTVYDYFHLGNARPFIVYDTLRRYLEYKGYTVRYVQNFTDIDDKVIKRAEEEGIACQALADRMITEYFVDADGLNIKRATYHPRATECIDEIIEMIQVLENKGFTYVLDDGVYYDTAKFPNYGKLSQRELDEQEQQERVSHHEGKRSFCDFVLWKFQKPGEPAWDAPWGRGRPGWHIECSAMNKKYLGATVDIHGGGQDLIFPHHENEIAQSEAANDKPFVRYWMHNGFINVDDVKMAKSEGNFFRVRDLAMLFPYAVLRFFMLQAHYRMPINFTQELLQAAQNGWRRMQNFARNLAYLLTQEEATNTLASSTITQLCVDCRREFERGMDDDLNTADAFAALFSLLREVNTLLTQHKLAHASLREVLDLFTELLAVLGLDPLDDVAEEIPQDIVEKAEERAKAKAEKNFAKADALRAEIESAGWKLEDTAEGTRIVKI